MIDLQALKTKTGKTVADFTIPAEFSEKYPEIIALMFESESMDDDERQYWFNLYASMDEGHIEKLRAILEKEKARRAEIAQKYQEAPKPPEVSPAEIQARNQAYSQIQMQQWQEIKKREEEARTQDESESEGILGEL